MMVCHEKKFAFYHMNKSGGTSICKMLETLPVEWEQIGKKHIPLSMKDFPKFWKYDVFTNIRNPFARIVSIYEYRRQFSQQVRFANVSFNEFFYEYWMLKPLDEFRPQHEYLFIGGKLPENIRVVKLEEADTEWPQIVRRYFQRDIIVQKLNTTKHGDPLSYFTRGMKSAVIKRDWWACEQYGLR